MRKTIVAIALVAAPVLAASTTTAGACWDDDVYVGAGYRSYGTYSDGPRYRAYRSYRRAGWYDPAVSVYVGPRHRGYRAWRSDWWW